MTLEQREDGWWIVNTPEGVDECGPYATKADAQEGLAGVKRFLKLCEAEGIGTEPKPKRKKRNDK